jgi:YD repeat-containing protein
MSVSDFQTANDAGIRSWTKTDGYGRTVEAWKYDTQGDVRSNTIYDALGRAKQVSNPYRPSLSEPIYYTTNNYDMAGRAINVTTPDGAVVSTNYASNAKTVTDQAGRQRRGITDALGRTIRVIEDPNGQNLATDYLFDTVGNLRQTLQGVQNRYFMYDSLGRLIRARQPEQDANAALALADPITANSQWSVAYAYDNVGNIISTTDSRGISVAGTYDNLNRMVFRDYSDVTPDVTFRYDDPAVTFSKGKLTKVSTSVSETRYMQFNNLGRLLSSQQVTSGQAEVVKNADRKITLS